MFGLAGAYFQNRNNVKARQMLEKCLEIQPENELILKQLETLKGKGTVQ